MGFPQWTLWGMGISILVALAALGYSLYLQSPARQVAYHAEPYRRESRIRAATTVAFALLLITFGFYAAGVPVGEQTIVVNNNAPSQLLNDGVAQAINTTDDVAAGGSDTAADAQAQAPSSGSFGSALPADSAEEQEADSAESTQPDASQSAAGGGTVIETPTTEASPTPTTEPTETPIPTPSATPTDAPTATPTATPTSTPTPLPTNTPTPTLTPTPITEATAQVATGGSTLWVKRSPGGQNLVILRDGETVILLPGNANQAGLLWKEVKTVQGVSGWVQAQFLSTAESEE